MRVLTHHARLLRRALQDESKVAVPTSRGKALADEFGIRFFETSAKLNINVENVFCTIARDITQRLADGADRSVDLEVAAKVKLAKKSKKNQKKDSSCC